MALGLARKLRPCRVANGPAAKGFLPSGRYPIREFTMRQYRLRLRVAETTAILVVGLCAATAQAGERSTDEALRDPAATASSQHRGASGHKLDRSGRARVGKASFYARRFAGRKMADGTPMDPAGANAASKTLPLGTVARVTNLETGHSTAVTIQDRGPYVRGRIIDLSPAKAQAIGITHKNGVARVVVAPIVVPTPGGGVKPGEGAATEVASTPARQLSR
jgi:rare lipoprotein A